MGRVCIFVDGENLRHSIEGLFTPDFRRGDYLPRDADWTGFFRWLCGCVSPEHKLLRTYWYCVGEVDFFPWRFPTESSDLRRILSKDEGCKLRIEAAANPALEMKAIVQELKDRREKFLGRFNGWRTLQNQMTQKHDNIEFRRSGTLSFNLFEQKMGEEKAVDVNLAVDLITLRDIYDVAIVVSGDADYVPAVQLAKNFGKTLVNVDFHTKNSRTLPGGARRLNQLCDRRITVPFDEMAKFMAIQPALSTSAVTTAISTAVAAAGGAGSANSVPVKAGDSRPVANIASKTVKSLNSANDVKSKS